MSDKKPDDALIGQTIAGRYRIISRLGAGGMGVAYRAWDEEESLPVEEGPPGPARGGIAAREHDQHDER